MTCMSTMSGSSFRSAVATARSPTLSIARRRLTAFGAPDARTGAPQLDHHPRALVVQSDENRLGYVEAEQVRVGRWRIGAAGAEEGQAPLGVGELLRPSAQLGVAAPPRRV